jgi:hypothetical protein
LEFRYLTWFGQGNSFGMERKPLKRLGYLILQDFPTIGIVGCVCHDFHQNGLIICNQAFGLEYRRIRHDFFIIETPI